MDMQNIYRDGSYLDRNSTWHVEDSPWKARQIMRMLARHELEAKTVVEVGCGAGEILIQLQAAMGDGHTFVGYEISPQAYALAQERVNASLHFRLEDLTTETTRTFDLLLAIDVIEHIEDCYGFLRKLQPRGHHKLFHFPLDLSVRALLSGAALMDGHDTVGHVHFFTKETALQTLRDSGYAILDSLYTPKWTNEQYKRTVRTTLGSMLRRTCFSINQDAAVRILGGHGLLVLAR